MYYVIISRHCTHMERELATALQDRKDVQVILDRRHAERRVEQRPVPRDRRRRQRRRTGGALPAG